MGLLVRFDILDEHADQIYDVNVCPSNSKVGLKNFIWNDSFLGFPPLTITNVKGDKLVFFGTPPSFRK